MFCFILTHWQLFEVEAHVVFFYLPDTPNSPVSVAKICVPQKLAGESWRPCLVFIVELKTKLIFKLNLSNINLQAPVSLTGVA